MRLLALSLIITSLSSGVISQDDRFRPLFNGKDLRGWVNVNGAQSTWTVRNGIIRCTGIPTGILRTERMYENYVLELEWMHTAPGGNAGLFVHSGALPVRGQPFTKSIEVQVLAADDPNGNWTGHGDVFAIHGATFIPDRPHPQGWMRSLPSERRAKPAGEWNHYRVECLDGSISLAVNGKVVSGGTQCNPRRGYICLESEGSVALFRNIRIQELPPSPIETGATSEPDRGFVSLYDGTTLRDWIPSIGSVGSWTPRDWTLVYNGSKGGALWSKQCYNDFELILDVRLPESGGPSSFPLQFADGNGRLHSLKLNELPIRPGVWNRIRADHKSGGLRVYVDDRLMWEGASAFRERAVRLALLGDHSGAQFANIYLRNL